MSNGKWLEELVATIERSLVPQGFEVTVSDKRFLESGVQAAEFDVVVRGRVGTGEFSWLIECRDRPSEGPAPSLWIQQLSGRRQLFRHNKVSAVSTTGFAEPAIAAATALDVELRAFTELDADAVRTWLAMTEITFHHRHSHASQAVVRVTEDTPPERQAELLSLLKSDARHGLILRGERDDQRTSLAHVFLQICQQHGYFDRAVPDGPKLEVVVRATLHADDSPVYVDLPSGPLKISAIDYRGEVFVRSELISISRRAEYKTSEGGAIAEIVTFGPAKVPSQPALFLEFHKTDTGTHVYVRAEKS